MGSITGKAWRDAPDLSTPIMAADLEAVEAAIEAAQQTAADAIADLTNRAGPHVVLRFDDGYQNNLTVAAPILARYGMRGTLFTGTHPTNWLGTVKNGSQILTASELVRLHTEYGWEIASHTRGHVDALSGGLDLSAFMQNVRGSIGDLVSYGLPRPRSFAYANGSRSPALDRAMYRMFDKIALTGHPNRVPMPYDKPIAFSGWIAVDESTGTDVRDRLVEMAKIHIQTCFERGLIPVIGFHGILAAPTNSFDLNTATFTELIEWIAVRGYPVGTLSETRSHNLLSNPGFEEHPVRTWSTGSHPWGTNRSTGWQQVADNSENASNTIMRLDTGGVAIDGANAVSVEQHIPVTPGASYKLYVNVRQPGYVSGSVRVNVYFHDPLGVERSQSLGVVDIPKQALSSWVVRPVGTFTAPTGAASARIHIQSHSAEGFNGTCEIAWLAVFDASTYDPWTA